MIQLLSNRRAWLAALSSLLPALAGLAAGSAPSLSQYQVKAAFLFNFAKFVEWPANAFASAEAPLVIGIVGDDPFGSTLDELVRGQTAQGHPLVVRRCRTDEELKTCHTLFIANSEKERLARVLGGVRTRPILTVGDTPNFAEEGIMINLALVQGRVKMEVNRQAAEDAQLRISSKLLGLAKIVGGSATPTLP